jgi:hypothetical protein
MSSNAETRARAAELAIAVVEDEPGQVVMLKGEIAQLLKHPPELTGEGDSIAVPFPGPHLLPEEIQGRRNKNCQGAH